MGEPGVHPSAPLGEIFKGAGLAREARALPARIEPARDDGRGHRFLVAHGAVRVRIAKGQTIDGDKAGEPVRQRLDGMHQHRAALAMADCDQRRARDRVGHGQQVPFVRDPAVQVGMLGVAVAALVVRHHAVAGIGQQRREDIEGPREIHGAMHQQDRRGVDRAPLMDGDADAVRADGARALRRPGAGEGRDGTARRAGGFSLHIVSWLRHAGADRLGALAGLVVTVCFRESYHIGGKCWRCALLGWLAVFRCRFRKWSIDVAGSGLYNKTKSKQDKPKTGDKRG